MTEYCGLFMVILIFLSSCTSEPIPTEIPPDPNLISTISPTTTSIPATATPTLTHTPKPIAVPLVYPGFEDQAFSSICVNVDIKEPEGSDQSTRIQEAIENLIKAMGMVVGDDGNCQAVIEVTGAMTGKSAQYENCGRLFTGADFRGKLTLNSPSESNELIAVPLSGANEIMDVVAIINSSDCDNLDEEANAPFSDIWQKPVIQGFSEIFGANALTGAILVLSLRSAAELAIDELDTNSKDVIFILQNLLSSEDEYLINYALFKIINHQDLAAIEPSAIIPILSNQNTELAALAARAIVKIGPAAGDAIPALLTTVSSNNIDLAVYSALALGEIGISDFKVLDALVNHLNGNESLVEACQSSLEKLTGRQFESIDEWGTWLAACSKTQSCSRPESTTPTPKPELVPLTFEDMEMFFTKVCLESSAKNGTVDISKEIDQLAGPLLEAMGMEIVQSDFECEIKFSFVLNVASSDCSRVEMSQGARLDLILPPGDFAIETVRLRNLVEISGSSDDCLSNSDIYPVLIYEGFIEYYGEPVKSASRNIKEINDGLVRLGIFH